MYEHRTTSHKEELRDAPLFAAAVAGDAKAVEQALHQAFAPQRVHPRREFFEIGPEQAIAILRLLDATDITTDVRAEANAAQSPADRRATARLRRPNLDFEELGIAPKTILVFDNDPEVRVAVVNNRQVKLVQIPEGNYGDLAVGEDSCYLSPLTRDLLSLDRNVPPTRYWSAADGRSLNQIYNEFHGPAG